MEVIDPNTCILTVILDGFCWRSTLTTFVTCRRG